MAEFDNEFLKEIGNTILSQMGGAGKIKAFVGTTMFTVGEMEYDGFVQPYIIFDFKMSKKFKYCRVIYEVGKDTYVMQFLNKNLEIVAEYNDVYCDDLVNIFENTTGLVLGF